MHPYFHGVSSHVVIAAAAPAIPRHQDHVTHLATPAAQATIQGSVAAPKYRPIRVPCPTVKLEFE